MNYNCAPTLGIKNVRNKGRRASYQTPMLIAAQVNWLAINGFIHTYKKKN
jgi:hypothetical protein